VNNDSEKDPKTMTIDELSGSSGDDFTEIIVITCNIFWDDATDLQHRPGVQH
jgi:hypothetical protein